MTRLYIEIFLEDGRYRGVVRQAVRSSPIIYTTSSYPTWEDAWNVCSKIIEKEERKDNA